jgi:hypothetical protein
MLPQVLILPLGGRFATIYHCFENAFAGLYSFSLSDDNRKLPLTSDGFLYASGSTKTASSASTCGFIKSSVAESALEVQCSSHQVKYLLS